MARPSINIQGLTFLIADANPYLASICQGILRGFGATRIIDVHSSEDAIEAMSMQRVSLLLCDQKLPPDGGFALTRRIREGAISESRTIPILILTNDTRASIINRARDSGANMVVAKPMSPTVLYDRLSWIAFSQRKFVDSPTYFGPDRRFKIEGFPNGVGRRAGDQETAIGNDEGPAMAQSDIDKLFSANRA